jgi:membrane fusion protein (multidrug efflux system)
MLLIPNKINMLTNRQSGIIFMIFIVLFLVTACHQADNQSQQRGGNNQPQPYPVIEIPRMTLTTFRSYPANIEGTNTSEVRAKVPGYITKVLVEEGQQVRKGQILFELETQSLSAEADALKANVDAARLEVDKLKPLVEQDIVSPVQLRTAEARLAQAQSSYQSAIASIGYARIKSPVDGVVGTIHYRKGSLVNAQDRLPLTRVSSIEKVYARFAMNEKDFLTFMNSAQGKTPNEKINNKPKIKLQLANGETYSHEGVIETVSGDVDPTTGTVSFRATFDNPEGLLRDGSSGTVLIPEYFENVPVVPALSTFEQQNKTLVYIVKGDTLVAAAIDVIAKVDKLYVIGQGSVGAGIIILAKGANQLRPGTRIIPQQVPIDSITQSFKTVF